MHILEILLNGGSLVDTRLQNTHPCVDPGSCQQPQICILAKDGNGAPPEPLEWAAVEIFSLQGHFRGQIAREQGFSHIYHLYPVEPLGNP